MNKQRKKALVLLVAAFVLLSFFIVVRQLGQLSDEEKIELAATSGIEDSSSHELNPNISNLDRTNEAEADIEIAAINEFKSSKEKRSLHRDLCGKDFTEADEQILNIIGRKSNEKIESLSQQQIVAIDAIISKCESWHRFLVSNRDFQQPEISSYERELWSKFSIVSHDELNKGLARELVASKDPNLSIPALAFLLSNDESFQIVVANSVESSDPRYVQNALVPIVIKSQCLLGGDCSSNGLTMLSLCSVNHNACGLSVDGYLYSIHSPQYVDDIIRMTLAIPSIVRVMSGG